MCVKIQLRKMCGASLREVVMWLWPEIREYRGTNAIWWSSNLETRCGVSPTTLPFVVVDCGQPDHLQEPGG